MTRIPGPWREAMFTGIWRKFILLTLSEENDENPRALEGGCVHWHLKKFHISNSIWGKSRESQVLGGRLCSLAFEESSYCYFYLRKITRISGPWMEAVFTGIWRNFTFLILSEENHENLRALEGGCVRWHLKKSYLGNFFWGKSQGISAIEGLFNWC
jgi:hypothetical protein